MDLYVANLPYEYTDDQLMALFGEYGHVIKVKLMLDTNTGSFKGYAFVSMNKADEAKNAIRALNGTEVSGRSIKVSMAQDQKG